MIDRFDYVAHATRVLFGIGRVDELPAEVDRLGWRSVMVLCTPGQRAAAQRIADALGQRLAAVHAGARMHVPREAIEPAVTLAQGLAVDGLVCYGGGSAIGLAKAVALQTGLGTLAVPTTYAGSEMTPIYGITEGGLKRTGRDPVVLPRVVIYDPALTTDLPIGVSVTSGLNAMAHAAEGLYARDGNPVVEIMATQGLRALSRALPALAEAPDNLEARSQALRGAWLSGMVLGSVGMALHHKLCHTLGGSFGLPHAETHAVVLPHALAYNAPCAREAMDHLARALDVEDGPSRLFAMLQQLGAPTSLRALGLTEDALDRVVELTLLNPYWNPRPLEPEALRSLLQRAWAGQPPLAGA
jgi:maleylacetate reductase